MRKHRYGKLKRALKGRVKFVVLRGTEEPYEVYHRLVLCLKKYGNEKTPFLGTLEPPAKAKLDRLHDFWNKECVEYTILELVKWLDRISPNGWHFHMPIFGIVLEWGWFRNDIYSGSNFRKEI